MYIYKISQDVNNGYDTYDSAIVVAPDEETARHTHPSGHDIDDDECCGTWANPKDVKVELVGTAAPHVNCCVLCSSFNAG